MYKINDDRQFHRVPPAPCNLDVHEDTINRCKLLIRRAGRRMARLRKALADKESELQAAKLRVRELDHRFANEMQILSSLMRSHVENHAENHARNKDGQRLPDNGAAFATQVAALADLHRLLALSGSDRIDLPGYLGMIVQHIRSAFQLEERVGIELRIDTIAVQSQTARTLALMINEAIVNALKHAFPDDHTGTVRVTLGKAPGALRLSVCDDGVGTGAGGSGPRLRVIRALTTQLGGELIIPAVEKGFQFDCVFCSD